MDKEKILSQNKKENLYLDEYEKHIKLQGKSFGLMFVLFICILILFIKAVCKEPYYDIMTIIGSVAFGSMGSERLPYPRQRLYGLLRYRLLSHCLSFLPLLSADLLRR